MANAHRTNVMITSCLKTPVDPHTKAPLALYERERTLPYTSTSHMDNRDYEKERELDDSCSERGDGDSPAKGAPLRIAHRGPRGRDRIDLRDVYFSNEEYYRKLEELKEAHLRTMAELEGMYRKKLDHMEGPYLLPWMKSSPAATHRLTRSHSALELRRGSAPSDEEGACPGAAADNDVEKGLLSSPKEHIKNMWRDFKLSPCLRRPSSSSLRSLPGGRDPGVKGRGRAEREARRPRATVPEPFGMTLREAERRRGGAKTRSEAALESAGLRRRLEEEELAECRRQFRASPVPAHVRLPLFEELRGRAEERRRAAREREEGRLRAAQRPFSFLERERLKREQREEETRRRPPQSDQEGAKPFKAKPVPRAVYEAASGDLMKEEELYRSIKSQMRARDLLDSASMPASMQARSLGAGRQADGGAAAAGSGDDGGGASPHLHRPKIHTEVPDFDASYRRFRKRLEEQRDVKPVTACEPFRLRTSQIAARRKDRAPADAAGGGDRAAALRWPGVRPGGPALTPGSSRCSSLSGSLELLPAKATDAARKRQEAVRKMLDQRRKAEEEEERWRVRQKQREKRLQKMVAKRAQANDPHLALSQTSQTRLKEFRKQDLQRRKEYKEEMREIQQRVKGRPLLLEQVAHMNARQAAEKRYTDALRGCGLSEDFVSGKVPKAQRPESPGSAGDAKLSDSDAPVVYNKVYLDGSDDSESKDEDGDRDEAERRDRDSSDKGSDSGDGADHQSDGGYHYSDDDEHYSEDGEQRLSGDVRNEDGDIKKCQSGLGMGSSQHRPNSQNSDSKSRAISDQKSDKED